VWPDLNHTASAQNWTTTLLRSVSLWATIDAVSVGVRLSVTPGIGLSTVYSFITRDEEYQRLQVTLAALLRADGLDMGRADAPHTIEEISDDYISDDLVRLAIHPEILTASNGSKIYLDVRTQELLPQLVSDADLLSIPITYELVATPWHLSKDARRTVLRDLVHVQNQDSTPPAMQAEQQRFADRVKTGNFHLQQCLAFVNEADAKHFKQAAEARLNDSVYGRFDAAPVLSQLDPDTAHAFGNLVHPHVMYGWPDETHSEDLLFAYGKGDLDNCLSFSSLQHSGKLIAPITQDDPPLESAPILYPLGLGKSGGPQESESRDQTGPFLFTSYARHDSELVVPTVSELKGKGVGIWIDLDISAGTEWDSELERSIMTCSGLLAFISPRFANSRYCRREIKFADALGKPIIPIILEDAELTDGLGFLMTTLQVLRCEPDLLVDRIRQSIINLAPTEFR